MKQNLNCLKDYFLDFDKEEILKKDLDALNKYKISNLTCKDIKGDDNFEES